MTNINQIMNISATNAPNRAGGAMSYAAFVYTPDRISAISGGASGVGTGGRNAAIGNKADGTGAGANNASSSPLPGQCVLRT